MSLAHDTVVSLETMVALVNTAGPDGGLDTVADLDAFYHRWSFSGTLVGDEAELAQVQALRPRLRELWCGDVDRVVELINAMLVEGRAMPQLVRHDDWDYHLHATTPRQRLDVRMTVEFAMAMADVVRAAELSRLRTCDLDDCDDVLVDLSRNRSRRFCSTQCGNLANVRAFRARQ